jgi:PncC family amidohydrolase
MNFDINLLQQTQKLFDLALKSNIKIATAESCTGGLISSVITEISGSSQIFDRGFVVYSNLSKQQNVGVSPKTLSNFGAVSKEVASEMAIGVLKNSQANLSIVTTGISGPNGATTNKPVGLVYISSFNSLNQNLITQQFNFVGNRSQNRMSATLSAIKILITQIKILNHIQ